MTRRTITLMQELPQFLRSCTVEELYQVAWALRHDLVRRGLAAGMLADQLATCLLVNARAEHRAIFSADCSAHDVAVQRDGECVRCSFMPGDPRAEQS